MSAWRFARNPKKTDQETAESEIGAGSQPFSNGPPGYAAPGDTGPEQATASPIPAAVQPTQSQPGWYPDTTDAGLMRYWDGFHFTGQAKRASSPESPTGNAPEGVQAPAPLATDVVTPSQLVPTVGETPDTSPAVPTWSSASGLPPLFAETTVASDQSQSIASDANSDFATKVPVVWLAPTATEDAAIQESAIQESAKQEEDETVEKPVVVTADNDSVSDRGQGNKEEPMVSSFGQGPADGVNNWGKDTELAVARALSIDTPEAWQEAGQVAAVVAEMTQTMQAAADAKQTARETAKAAEEAAEEARVAARAAVEAKDTAKGMSKAAEEAAETARVAAQTAVESKETAERTAQAAPKVAETADLASKTAADAQQKAQALEQVVANARAANTPAAWSEAHELAARAVEAKQSGDRASMERAADVAPPPVSWTPSTPLVGSLAESLDQALVVAQAAETKVHPGQDVDVLAELGPAPHLAPAPDGRPAWRNNAS
jgi:hypothetical protein